MKIYLNQNVLDAALSRIKYCFDNFDNVLVAFSGGKDSGVLIELCHDYARQHGLVHKMAMYHVDYEAQYEKTTEYVTETFDRMDDIRRFWLCLPISAQCAVNMRNPGIWYPWNPDEQSIWVRPLPQRDFVVHEKNVPFKFNPGVSDYEMQEAFCKWFSKTYGKTAVLIGIRTDESLNRFRVIASSRRVNVYKDKPWILGVGDGLTFKAYPIYDWSSEDIWVANAKFGYKYNRLYDLMYQAGVKLENMRVASPFNDCAITALKLYKTIEPDTWARLVGRVNGVNFAGIYGGTTAMGWRNIKLPRGYTWKQYCSFLLDTLDKPLRQNYEKKLQTSIRFWQYKGGALSDKTIAELKKSKHAHGNKGKVSRTSNKDVITFPEYPDDLDITDFKSVPTYKRMCICILKNDYFCKYMGFAATKEETLRKRIALDIYKCLWGDIK
ncbi:MAG: DUF3440 domain-containing protein [Alphaproteobacteria bacterium]|nr:DUF3440 domain-containing protein [Alphaproteobacteria bacterium]MCL2889984.1 DUF3440 domain-containing protein [Alphaproteobacteria bacterium]